MIAMRTHQIALLILCSTLSLSAHAEAITSFSRTMTVAGRRHVVHGVVVDLHDPSVRIKVGLAGGYLGHTESLGGIAHRYGAVAAINGSFFDAYTNSTLKNPDMTLISKGQLIFTSNLGALLGFERDNTPHLGVVRVRMTGTLEKSGRSQSWYVYWVNRKPTAAQSATLFTHAWGEQVAPMGGVSVVVEHALVTKISDETVTVPEDGYVVHIRGEASLRARFQVGERVTFSPELERGWA